MPDVRYNLADFELLNMLPMLLRLIKVSAQNNYIEFYEIIHLQHVDKYWIGIITNLLQVVMKSEESLFGSPAKLILPQSKYEQTQFLCKYVVTFFQEKLDLTSLGGIDKEISNRIILDILAVLQSNNDEIHDRFVNTLIQISKKVENSI